VGLVAEIALKRESVNVFCVVMWLKNKKRPHVRPWCYGKLFRTKSRNTHRRVQILCGPACK
jgi:hypothetical protein